jgi:hypothetical protein
MEHRVITNQTELAPNSHFTLWPATEGLQAGQLALFGFEERAIIGRWFPAIAGSDWILQPGRWIRVAPEVAGDLRVLGVVVPVETFDKEVGDTPSSEREAALKIVRSLEGGA